MSRQLVNKVHETRTSDRTAAAQFCNITGQRWENGKMDKITYEVYAAYENVSSTSFISIQKLIWLFDVLTVEDK